MGIKRRRLSTTKEVWTTDERRRSSTDSSVGGDTAGGAKRPRLVIQVYRVNHQFRRNLPLTSIWGVLAAGRLLLHWSYLSEHPTQIQVNRRFRLT